MPPRRSCCFTNACWRPGTFAPDEPRPPHRGHNPVTSPVSAASASWSSRVLAVMKIASTGGWDHDPTRRAGALFGNKPYYGDARASTWGARRARARPAAVSRRQPDRRDADREDLAAAFPQNELIVPPRAERASVPRDGRSGRARKLSLGMDAANTRWRALDMGPVAARRVVARFRRHDEEMLASSARTATK